MSLLKSMKLRPFRFARDEAGSMPTEGVIASVFLVWWYVASFQFFDAYRQKNINLKAAYTVADLISRQTNEINDDFIEGLNTLFDYLTNSRVPTWIRVSSVVWDETDNRFEIAWSYATGVTAGHTTATIQAKANQIPVMPSGDSVIIVESNMAYEPIFNVGLKAQWFTTFIATRPRFNPCIAFDREDGSQAACIFDADIDPDGTPHDDGNPTVPDETT